MLNQSTGIISKRKIGRYRSYTFSRGFKTQYLSFLASFSKVPILYVHGNHDDCYDTQPPDGCIDMRIRYMCIKVSVLWDLVVLYAIRRKEPVYTERDEPQN